MWKPIAPSTQKQLETVYHNKIHELNAAISKTDRESDIARLRAIRHDYIRKLHEARNGFAWE